MSTSVRAGLRVLGLAVALALLLLHAFRYDFVADDAFITARYVRNLLAGEGLVYNPGERVEGFTSPLWAASLALLGALGVDLAHAMRGLSLESRSRLWLGLGTRSARLPGRRLQS